MNLEGSKTQTNLTKAFEEESKARNRYTFYAKNARQEGYEQIGEIFDLTAKNEKEHAELWFKYLHNGEIPNTKGALIDAANGENYEWSQMYKEFASVAQQEGFDQVASTMNMIANVEKEHETRFRKLMDNLEKNEVFEKNEEITWICRNCGHEHKGKKSPTVCPSCNHAQAYFEIKSVNY